MTSPAGPSNPPPPPAPGRNDKPLDPKSPEGIAVAERLTRTLARIELEIDRRETADRIGRAA